MSKKISKKDELERYFKKYPDVPREVIVKEDMLRFGVMFTEAALEVTKGCRTKAYGGALFSWDFSTHDTVDKSVFSRLPERLDLRDGEYGLRGRVRVLTRLNPDSPYTVDVIDGSSKVCVQEGKRLVPIADLHDYRPRPKYWSKYFEDGTPYREISKAESHILAFKLCHHWGPKEECKFCDINENWRMTHERGVAEVKRTYLDFDQVAEVTAEIFREKREPVDRPIGTFIDGGAIRGKLAGLDEVEFYLKYVDAIRDKIGTKWPIHLAMAPKPKNIAKKMRERGVTGVNTNFEVWDKRLFKIMCPGKDRVVGHDNWIRLMIEMVDIFGEGNVMPGFVAGVEMAQPWGFKKIDDALKSTTAGLEYLMSHGVVPRPITWAIEPRSALRGQKTVPLDYFIKLDRNWYELMCKYRLPSPNQGIWARVLGPGRWEYPCNASGDMGDEPKKWDGKR